MRPFLSKFQNQTKIQTLMRTYLTLSFRVGNKSHKLEDLEEINPWRAEPGRSGWPGGLYRLEAAKRERGFEKE